MGIAKVSREECKVWIVEAKKKMLANDMDLLKNEVHEQCLCHRFAVYLEKMVKSKHANLHVDCEYNRRIDNPKILDDKNIRPDIIVHLRGKLHSNVLVIEAKKESCREYCELCDKDKVRLESIMDDEMFLYQNAVLLTFTKSDIEFKFVEVRK